jgi:tight adherence protein B
MLSTLDPIYAFYALAAISAALLAESVYLVAFSARSYRSGVNRRLRLLKDEPDRESVLIELRRRRGLTTTGLYALPARAFNRLILQSGLSMGMTRLLVVNAIATVVGFGFLVMLGLNVVGAAAAAVGVVMLLCWAVLTTLRRRRHHKFGSQFPDALDIIVRSLRAGHPVPVAIAMVGREMADPVGSEFGIASDEITYGADLETAMRNLYFRVGQEDLPLFVTAVAIQGSTGGNLSEILSNLSSVIRLRFKMRRKIKALAAEGKFSALFLSGLPVAVFLLINAMTPDFYGSIINYDLTKWGLGLAATWMLMGNVVMYKMCNFRI